MRGNRVTTKYLGLTFVCKKLVVVGLPHDSVAGSDGITQNQPNQFTISGHEDFFMVVPVGNKSGGGFGQGH